MKNNAVIPTLSQDGWVDTPLKAADYLFSHLFLSDYSQTYIYYPHVSSIPYILFRNQTSITELARDLKNTIELYFSQHFDGVNCEVLDTSGDGTSGSVTIYLELRDGETTFTLGKVMEYTDSKIKSVIDYNNG
jgi:hypothetical protein